MVYIPNAGRKRELKKAQEKYALEEKERKKKQQKDFAKWQKENPGKGLIDYILKQ